MVSRALSVVKRLLEENIPVSEYILSNSNILGVRKKKRDVKNVDIEPSIKQTKRVCRIKTSLLCLLIATGARFVMIWGCSLILSL